MAESMWSYKAAAAAFFESSPLSSSAVASGSSRLQSGKRHNRQYRKTGGEIMPTEKDNDVTSGSRSPHQTVLRLKRRVEDSPSQVLLMSYSKRRKNEDGGYEAKDALEDDSENCTSIFRFAGTMQQDKEEPSNVAEVIRKAMTEVDKLHSASKDSVKRREVNVAAKTKEAVKKHSLSNRFKVVSNKRGIEESDFDLNLQSLDQEKYRFNMLDLVADCIESAGKSEREKATRELGTVCVNGVPMIKESHQLSPDAADTSVITKSESESGFVFDLYVTSKAIPTNQICDKYVSVTCEDDPDFGKSQYDEGSDEDDFRIPDDDEDSNEEDNWRNDYPDSDPEDDGHTTYFGQQTRRYGDEVDDNDDDDDEYVTGKLGGVKISGDDDLSSDDGEDEIYTLENNGEDDVSAENLMFSRYLRYRDRVAQEMNLYGDGVVSSPPQSDAE